MNLTSIIIPTTKRTSDYLKFCEKAIATHTDVIKTPIETIMMRDESMGYAAKNASGVKKAEGDMLCFMSDDILVMDGWLERFWLLYNEAKTQCKPGLMGVYLPPFGVAQDYNRFSPHFVACPFIVTALSFITPEAYKASGGWDENFPSGNYADTDLSIRVEQAGFTNLILPMVAFHFISRSFHTAGGENWQEDMKTGRQYLEWKHGEDWQRKHYK